MTINLSLIIVVPAAAKEAAAPAIEKAQREGWLVWFSGADGADHYVIVDRPAHAVIADIIAGRGVP